MQFPFLVISNNFYIFAEKDSDVSFTNLAFNEINTSDFRQLRQLIRLPYGKIRPAVDNLNDKFVSAEIARLLILP